MTQSSTLIIVCIGWSRQSHFSTHFIHNTKWVGRKNAKWWGWGVAVRNLGHPCSSSTTIAHTPKRSTQSGGFPVTDTTHHLKALPGLPSYQRSPSAYAWARFVLGLVLSFVGDNFITVSCAPVTHKTKNLRKLLQAIYFFCFLQLLPPISPLSTALFVHVGVSKRRIRFSFGDS